jgi:anti-sigma factor RsiW
MNCESFRELLVPYLDRELGARDVLDLERHLPACRDCRQAMAEITEASAVVRAHARYHSAPEGLAGRIATTVPAVSPAPARAATKAAAQWARTPNWFGLASTAVALVALSLLVRPYLFTLQPAERLAESVQANHIRSLQADHLADVASSDQHTVKPWFNGRLDFSPAVVDLTTEGFPLVGGRLDYLDGHSVAALVYHRRQHPINLFIWPHSSKAPGRQTETATASPLISREGFNMLHWSQDGMEHWAVSDLNSEELANFVRIFRKHRGLARDS